MQPTYVCSVASESPAWYCGLRPGDQLWSINNKFVRGELLETVKALLLSAQGQTILAVSMLRDVQISRNGSSCLEIGVAADGASPIDVHVDGVCFLKPSLSTISLSSLSPAYYRIQLFSAG